MHIYPLSSMAGLQEAGLERCNLKVISVIPSTWSSGSPIYTKSPWGNGTPDVCLAACLRPVFLLHRNRCWNHLTLSLTTVSAPTMRRRWWQWSCPSVPLMWIPSTPTLWPSAATATSAPLPPLNVKLPELSFPMSGEEGPASFLAPSPWYLQHYRGCNYASQGFDLTL